MMIEDPLLRQYAQEVGEEVTLRLVRAFDRATRREGTDRSEAVLQEAIQVLQERIREAAERQG